MYLPCPVDLVSWLFFSFLFFKSPRLSSHFLTSRCNHVSLPLFFHFISCTWSILWRREQRKHFLPSYFFFWSSNKKARLVAASVRRVSKRKCRSPVFWKPSKTTATLKKKTEIFATRISFPTSLIVKFNFPQMVSVKTLSFSFFKKISFPWRKFGRTSRNVVPFFA